MVGFAGPYPPQDTVRSGLRKQVVVDHTRNVGGFGVSEADGVLRYHYHPPSVNIYIEKRLTNQSVI